jgi:hypothetical protein
MSWVVKASPRLKIFEPLRTKRILVIISDGGSGYLYLVSRDMDNEPPHINSFTGQPIRRWWRGHLSDEDYGDYVAKTGTVPEDMLDKIDDGGYEGADFFVDNAENIEVLDRWEVYEPEEEDDR